ncbi:histone H4.2 [Thermoascus aurantiacus ATCC 26904]
MDPKTARKHPKSASLLFGSRRHRKLLRNNIQGITRPAIRRLARRGGVVRIERHIYNEVRVVIRERITEILRQLVIVMDSATTPSRSRKTVTTRDIVYVLKRSQPARYSSVWV